MAPQFDRAIGDMLRATACTFLRQSRGSHEICYSLIIKRNFPMPIGIPGRRTANTILRHRPANFTIEEFAEMLCSKTIALVERLNGLHRPH
jgi:hypothetical protein